MADPDRGLALEVGAERGEHLALGLGVESLGGLVEDPDVPALEEGAGQVQPAYLPTREMARAGSESVRKQLAFEQVTKMGCF
ncbi:hypothetical protein ODE01S_21540 [Oceanithermus desulfurans NBRC 100063]|uniref:Uncharacterized protein n=1 Tax=Oceanithermus desulfurans NBRC 100063 TaxID=1227550 RepID=A0A511RM41_9DEIN|nr:hypothetical protein ODE01S_21540 [Oceanithermus desulfurans NBRC 100063]